MNSCAASCCTCFPKASYASAISVSWPIGDAPLSCHFAFTCSEPHSNRRSTKTPLPPMISGVARSVVDRWWSSRGSPLQKSNCVLLRCSPPHERTLSHSKSSRASACSAPLRLAEKQIASPHRLRSISTILPRWSQFPTSSAVLYRATPPAFSTAVSLHSISIGPHPPQPRPASF